METQQKQSKFVAPKKVEEKKVPKYPRFINDSYRDIIRDLKNENDILRRRNEQLMRSYRQLEKEMNDYKMGIFAVREIDLMTNEGIYPPPTPNDQFNQDLN